MSYPPNQPPPGPGWGGQDQGGWAPPPGPDQGWGPGPGQQPPGPPQQWAEPGYGTPPPGAPGGGVPYQPQKKSSPALPIAIIVVLIAAAAGAFFVLSQGDDGGDPEAVATDYVEALIDRDCGAMADIVNMEGTTPADALAQCQAAVSEGANEFIPTELISTRVVSEEEDTATVAAEVRLGSGDTTTQDVDLTRIDGDWRVNIDLGGTSPDDTIPPPADDPDDTADDPDDTTTTTEDEPETTTTTEASTTDTTDSEGYTDEDHANRAACEGGDMAACDDLWSNTPAGSAYEDYAETCGGRAPEGGHIADCEATFG